jgi:hypothetical protein
MKVAREVLFAKPAKLSVIYDNPGNTGTGNYPEESLIHVKPEDLQTEIEMWKAKSTLMLSILERGPIKK